MTNSIQNSRAIGFALAVAAALAMTACSQQAPPPPAPATPGSSVPPTGRYQIATISEGDRGSTLVLLDTTTGETWLFHTAQGPLFNGFWGDIPRVTSPGETWRQAFQTLLQTPSTNRPTAAPLAPTR